MITVHHLDNSRSQRILWLMEELGLEYEVRIYRRDEKTLRAPESLKAAHPLGKAPVVTEGPLTLAETGAIIEYIVETHGAGRLTGPRGSQASREISYWHHYAEGSAMPLLLLRLVLSRIPQNTPLLLRPIASGITAATDRSLVAPQLADHIAWWEQALARSGWFAGDDFSTADIMMSFPLEAAAQRADAGRQPNIAAFLKRIHARPAYRLALERGGPYVYA